MTAPSGPTAVPPISITELQPLHTYHYRIVAENSFGTTYGPDKTFTTFSAAGDRHALDRRTSPATTADLHAVINPHGVEAEYHFEYGPTIALRHQRPDPRRSHPGGRIATCRWKST